GQGLGDLALEGAADRLHRAAEGNGVVAQGDDGRRLLLRLLGRTRPLGHLVLARRDAPFSETERAWTHGLARRIAVEIENIRLADQAQRAQDEARRALQRVHHYERLTGALSEATTPPQVLEALLGQAGPLLGASGGAVAMMTADRTGLDVVAASGGTDALTGARRALALFDRAPLPETARSGHPVAIEYLRAAVPQYEHLSRLAPALLDGAVVALPLVLKGRSIGAVGLVFPGRRTLSAEEWTTVHALARHCADAMERVRLYDAERRARAEAGEEARRLELLADTSRILADSLDYRSALQRFAEKLVPAIADWCAVYEARDGKLEPVVSFHREPAKRADLDLLVRASGGEGSAMGVDKVVATGRPVLFFNVPEHLLPGIARDETQLALLRAVGVTSQMMVPIVSREQVLGVLAVTYTGFRRYAPGDVVFVEALARRVAVAIENARLYQSARESEERYRLLVEGVRDYALFYLDPEGRVATWTPAAERLFGYTPEEALGMPHDLFYEPEAILKGNPRENRERAKRDGRFEEEGIRIRKDGARILVNVSITALWDPRGQHRGYVLLMRDLTETVRAREALERTRTQLAASEKLSALGTLVSGVAHEIRTPLTAMSNNLHLLEFRLKSLLKKDPTLPVGQLLEQVNGSIEGIDRLNRLVEDLRKFARVKAGTVARVPLNAPVGDALRLFGAAHRGRVEVEGHLEATPVLEIDVLQVQQVVLNLLQNAAEAMPHGGKVRVRTAPHREGGVLVIEDEGEGMTPEVRARMFEEFFTTKTTGTGLGLSIVRRIVEAHHGSIECESEPGKGTRFTIVFPERVY
ncbi:MAG TPA: ATP-binding protein, partial [Candidatus Thermoplasmatota archaeon]|nr:ATP-binding protein [Candidatus Thermoplasmatota archaeon]